MEKPKSRIVFSGNSPFTYPQRSNGSHITSSFAKLSISGIKNNFTSEKPVVIAARPALCLTSNIIYTYKKCNPEFQPVKKLPRRILTQPSDGVLNNGLDNEESNLVCRVHDILEGAYGKYTILDLLGTGTFGQVFRSQKDDTKEVVAIKVIKNKPAYHNQGQLEAKIAKLLNQKYDTRDERHIVRLLHNFECKGHICLVFELLSMSLLDTLTQNQFRGLPLNVVQRFTKQILVALVTFQEAEVIHCDLKPENILLSTPKTPATTPQPPPAASAEPAKTSKSLLGSAASTLSGLTTLSSSVTLASAASCGETYVAHGKMSSSSAVNLSRTNTNEFGSNSSGSDFASPVTTNASSSPATSTATVDLSNKDASTTAAGTAAAGTSGGSGTQPPRTAMWSDVKVIDLGSACFEGQTMYSYIQSRFYRSPEVLLGVPYNGAIDMWSLGCVCAEMFLGLPLFPGVSQHNQLTRIVEMFGSPPDYLIDGKNGHKYFTYIGNSTPNVTGSSGTGSGGSSSGNNNAETDDDYELSRQQQAQHRGFKQQANTNATTQQQQQQQATAPNVKVSKYRIKTAEEYARETKTDVPALKKYLRYNRLEDVVLKYPLLNRSRMTPEQKREEILKRHCFLNFLEGLFCIDPFQRWTAKQAANHPFMTGAPFQGKYIPPVDPKVNDRKLAYLLQMQHRHDSNRNNNSSNNNNNNVNNTINNNMSSNVNNNAVNVTGVSGKGGLLYGNSSLFKNILQPNNTAAAVAAANKLPPQQQLLPPSSLQPQQQQSSSQQQPQFMLLSRRQSEPMMGAEMNQTQLMLEEQQQQYLEFESRPVLQRGKPVVPEKYSSPTATATADMTRNYSHNSHLSQSGSDSNYSSSNMALPDQSNMISTIQPYNPNDPYANANNRLVQQHHDHNYNRHNHPAEKNLAYTPYHLNNDHLSRQMMSKESTDAAYHQQQQQQYRATAHTYTAGGQQTYETYSNQFVPFQQSSQKLNNPPQQSQQNVSNNNINTANLSQSYVPPQSFLSQQMQQQQQQPYNTNNNISSTASVPGNMQSGGQSGVAASSYGSSSSIGSFAVGSLPGVDTGPIMSDFGQALIRPEMDEQRYFHSQQSPSQQQLHQQQQQLQYRQQHDNNAVNMLQQQQLQLQNQQQLQQQQQQRFGWFNAPRNRLSSAGATLMSNSPAAHQQQQQKQQNMVSRSYDLKPKGFLSSFMGNFRNNDPSSPSSSSSSNNNNNHHHNFHNSSSSSNGIAGGGGSGEDELATTYHGIRDRASVSDLSSIKTTTSPAYQSTGSGGRNGMNGGGGGNSSNGEDEYDDSRVLPTSPSGKRLAEAAAASGMAENMYSIRFGGGGGSLKSSTSNGSSNRLNNSNMVQNTVAVSEQQRWAVNPAISALSNSNNNNPNNINNINERWMGASTHSMQSTNSMQSMNSQGSMEFPIVNRHENARELERARAGEREVFKLSMANEMNDNLLLLNNTNNRNMSSDSRNHSYNSNGSNSNNSNNNKNNSGGNNNNNTMVWAGGALTQAQQQQLQLQQQQNQSIGNNGSLLTDTRKLRASQSASDLSSNRVSPSQQQQMQRQQQYSAQHLQQQQQYPQEQLHTLLNPQNFYSNQQHPNHQPYQNNNSNNTTNNNQFIQNGNTTTNNSQKTNSNKSNNSNSVTFKTTPPPPVQYQQQQQQQQQYRTNSRSPRTPPSRVNSRGSNHSNNNGGSATNYSPNITVNNNSIHNNQENSNSNNPAGVAAGILRNTSSNNNGSNNNNGSESIPSIDNSINNNSFPTSRTSSAGVNGGVVNGTTNNPISSTTTPTIIAGAGTPGVQLKSFSPPGQNPPSADPDSDPFFIWGL